MHRASPDGAKAVVSSIVRVNVRRATDDDLPALQARWREFQHEVPPAPHVEVDEAKELAEISAIVEAGLAFVAEADAELIGLALARLTGSRVGRLTDLYVQPNARRAGVAAALVHEVAEVLANHGAEVLDLEVSTSNAAARTVYQHWGFAEESVTLAAPLSVLVERLQPGRHATSFASIHVQSDEVDQVERAARAFAPRIASRGTRLEGPRDGWVTVYDEAADRDPAALLRLAREISSRLGIVVMALSLEVDQVVRLIALDRGGIVDEYLSVPEFYGQLPPGDVIGLAANPTVLSRLTGADPRRIKAVATTATAPGDLPPARELLATIASELGLQGANRGYASE